MQGTLKDWMELGGEVEHGHVTAIKADELYQKQPARYQARDSTSMVSMDSVKSIVRGESRGIILDARSEGRFKGIAPEPRVGLRGGCIPHSFNVPATELLDGSKYLTAENLIDVFKKAGVEPLEKQKIICSCGSGVTACVIASALEACGRDPADTLIFDGSWIEWASDTSNPVDNESQPRIE
jgi:thiosulfate/3-mercaptopyruvate sulfurtransferase